jgi:hypothetical protein
MEEKPVGVENEISQLDGIARMKIISRTLEPDL